MQRKKIILITSLIAILIIVLLTVFFFRKNGKETISPDTSSSSSGMGADEKIKNAFKKYLEENPSGASIQRANFFQLTDDEDRLIPLDKFSDEVGLKVAMSLIDIVSNTDYSVFYCLQDGRKDYGIAFNIKTKKNYTDIINIMQEWESTMFLDTKSVIFPDVTDPNFANLNANTEFKDGAFRYADINMPDGSQKSINYYVNPNSIFIANSKECLYKTFPDTEVLKP